MVVYIYIKGRLREICKWNAGECGFSSSIHLLSVTGVSSSARFRRDWVDQKYTSVKIRGWTERIKKDKLGGNKSMAPCGTDINLT